MARVARGHSKFTPKRTWSKSALRCTVKTESHSRKFMNADYGSINVSKLAAIAFHDQWLSLRNRCEMYKGKEQGFMDDAPVNKYINKKSIYVYIFVVMKF